MHARAAILLLLLTASGSAGEDRAALAVHGLFGDGMVLQRDRPCPVWGTAAPGTNVAVSIAGQTKSVTAGVDGHWSLRLDPLTAGGPHEMTVDGPDRVTFRDVLVGDVWLAAGASNMELPLKAAKISQTDSDEDAIGQIRFFSVPKGSSDEPVRAISGSWKSGRSEAAADFSAVAYYFAREIRRTVKVPVGVLQASTDDTRIDRWMSPRALRNSRAGRGILTLHGMQLDSYLITFALYQGYLLRAEEAKRKGEPPPRVLYEPPKPNPICDQYYARIVPLLPYAIRGAIYYQGEVELYRSPGYESLLAALIQDWREDWGQGDFPFGLVQLANFGNRDAAPLHSQWAHFRESQRRATVSTPNTGMAVAIDLGEADNLRPRNKEDVGKRLALWAQSQVYGMKVVWSGPFYESMRIEGEKIRIRFKNVGGGLHHEGRLRGFKMSGDFQMFVDADAVIDGDDVVVSSEGLRWPAAVRYAWGDNPNCNLTNKEGLPASPFRTDSW